MLVTVTLAKATQSQHCFHIAAVTKNILQLTFDVFKKVQSVGCCWKVFQQVHHLLCLRTFENKPVPYLIPQLSQLIWIRNFRLKGKTNGYLVKFEFVKGSVCFLDKWLLANQHNGKLYSLMHACPDVVNSITSFQKLHRVHVMKIFLSAKSSMVLSGSLVV